MTFSQTVADKALVACGRCCCICHEFCGTKIELHHIHQHADGGEDTFENCIPLCLNCHADMGRGDSRHPKGKRYTEHELRMHRDQWYEIVRSRTGVSSEIPQNNQRFNDMRKKAAETLCLYADRLYNPVDLAQIPDHILPSYYVEASNALRKLGSEIIAEAAIIDENYPISREQLQEVGKNFIGLSNSMTTPYAQGISIEKLRLTESFENKIRELFSLPKR